MAGGSAARDAPRAAVGAVLTMWPFSRRTETRATPNATDALVSALERQAAGKIPDPAALAVAEACAGLWERALASATVAPMSTALMPLTPGLLALVARGLASRGEFLAVLRVDEMTGLRLVPSSSWDVRGTSDPTLWRYRVDLAGPSLTESINLPPDAVLHIRIGADPQTPWRGRSPLRRSRATAELAVSIEAAMNREAQIPPARFTPSTGTPGQAAEYTKAVREGGIIGTSFGQPLSAEQVPSSRWQPAKMGPEPDEAFHALRTQTGQDICAAFGVPPTLFNASGDGAGQREAWRRFWLGTVAPMSRVIEAECRAKLDPAAELTLDALRASDEDGRSRAIARRAQAFKTFRDAEIGRDEALRLAGLA